MIKIIKKSEKDKEKGITRSFNFPDDDPQSDILVKISKIGIGYELICEEFRKGNLRPVREQHEDSSNYDYIEYGW